VTLQDAAELARVRAGHPERKAQVLATPMSSTERISPYETPIRPEWANPSSI